jgi:hypothetical protein
MITVSKGKLFGCKQSVSFLFEFKNESFQIDNFSKIGSETFDTCVLDEIQATELIEWIKNVIEKNKICDGCYNYTLPINFAGEIVCLKCNNVIKNI